MLRCFSWVEKMISLGHKQIHYVNYTGNFNHYSIDDTVAGYVDAMKAHDLDVVMLTNRIERSNRMAASKKLLESGMDGNPVPTAIMAMGMSSAIPFVQAAGELGIRIPEQLSVYTIDSSSLPSAITPAISQAAADLSLKAVQKAQEKN